MPNDTNGHREGAPIENFKPGTIWTGDNLPILRGLNSETVDLIYLDPPFNSNQTYSAPIGSEAAGAAFKDTWTLNDTDDAWHGEIADKDHGIYQAISASEFTHGKSMKAYLIMMAVRMLEMRRVLKPTGSIYLHCDPTASHYLKLLMDAVFNRENFRNEIAWCYSIGGRPKNDFARKHDVILRYVLSDSFTFNSDDVRLERKKTHMREEIDSEGNVWQIKRDAKTGKIYRYPVKAGALCPDWWIEIEQLNRAEKERTGYPTQKPLALLERIIKASSNKGDLVLDPFCGCATTLIAAERLGRRWLGIDLSPKAVELVKIRMQKEKNLWERFNSIHRTDIPQRTDTSRPNPNYRTHKHELFGRQEGVCNGCKHAFPFRNFTVDHRVPQAKGGTDHIENLQLLCGACNSMKGKGTHEELIVKLQTAGLFSVFNSDSEARFII